MINTYINLLVTQPYYGAKMARYLITLDSEVHADRAAAQAAITDAGADVIKTYEFSLTFEIEATAEQIPNIIGVVEHIEKAATTAISVQVLNQDHLTNLAAISHEGADSYQPENTGAGSHVYLVDTGLYAEHEQFVGRNINNLYSNFSTDFSDSSGHGTAMASVIIGNTQGVSKDATLHNVKLFEASSSNITLGEIVDALDAVLVHHNTNNNSKVKVVCLPWTTPQNNFLDNKIIEMNNSNLLVVAAAGNDGIDLDTVSPGGVNIVITVGSYNADLQVTEFTNVPWNDPAAPYNNNYGAALDIFALGVDVSCATIASTDSYALVSGTSISAGIVAGVAAQWTNLQSTKTATELKDIILQEGHITGQQSLTFDPDSNIANSNVYRSVATTAMIGAVKLGNLPSGRVLSVQLGLTATKDLELDLANGTDFGVLAFAPLPPWASIDFATGVLTADTSSLDPTMSPGLYLFGVKGKISDTVVIEEYSIGIYTNDPREVDDCMQYYYDLDTDSYDQMVPTTVSNGPKF